MSVLRSLKTLNLFETYSTDPEQIKRELGATRLYLVLLPTILTILIIYSAQKQLYHTVEFNNPSIETYQALIHEHPNTLLCPCSQLSVGYAQFVTLQPNFHPVCSSPFISDLWLAALSFENATFYIPIDIRSIGLAQWQLVRSLCESSRKAIDNAFKSTFTSTYLTDGHGMLLKPESVRVQVNAVINDFISNLNSEHRRRRALFKTFFDRNFLVSGLLTAATPVVDSSFELKMNTTYYTPMSVISDRSMGFRCGCDATYDCLDALGVWNYFVYEPNLGPQISIITEEMTVPLQNVRGFKAGCLPLNALLSSSLECYYDQNCLDNVTRYLLAPNTSFPALDTTRLIQSDFRTLIGDVADRLMVESWSSDMDYGLYFSECHPISCSYSYTDRFSVVYIITTLLGVFGGLTKVLRILCPGAIRLFYRIFRSRPVPTPEQKRTLKIRMHALLNRLYHTMLTLNLFKKRNSEAEQIRQQIVSTRLYLGSLIGLTTILVLVTAFQPRMVTITVSRPNVSQFEELFQSGKLPRSCPCSQIAIPREAFTSIRLIFHQVCSSTLVSEDWFDRLSYTINPRSVYHNLDIRSYGLDMFRTILSLCSLANQTAMDATANFLEASWISSQVIPRQQFYEQTEALLIDFQSNLKHQFEQLFHMARDIIQANQVLSGRVSNFFFDGRFDDQGRLTNVQTYIGITTSANVTFPSCSCVLDSCSQQLGLFNMNSLDGSYSRTIDVPGMYGACYPLDALKFSTLECWFDESCIDLIFSHLTPFPVERRFDPLNASRLIEFSPTDTLGDIIEHLMIEQILNTTDYEMYYKTCQPSACVYTSFVQLDGLYIVTMLTSVFGGLSAFLRIACPLVIKLYFRCERKRKRAVIHPHEIVTAPRSERISFASRLQRLVTAFNLFDSQSPYGQVQRRERLSTRLYVVLLILSLIFLFIYTSLLENIRKVSILSPSSDVVAKLQKKHFTTLSCPCTQTAISYSSFLTFQVEKHHPICSSMLLNGSYLRILMGDNFTVMPDSVLFKRQFLGSQLSLLSTLCALSQRTLNVSLALFLRQQFINAQVLTRNQFYEQMNITIQRFITDISLSMRHSLDYLQSTTHGNAIMTSYTSNWRFQPDFSLNRSRILTRPVWYGDCSCARSMECVSPMNMDNRTFPGLAIGCLPSSVLLQSTLGCLYNQTCLDMFHSVVLNDSSGLSLPRSVSPSSHFSINDTIGSLIDALFVEKWFYHYDYEAFFRACAISACNYIFIRRPDVLYVVTTMIGLIGGLNIVLRFLSPLLVLVYVYSMDRIQKRKSTPIQPYVSHAIASENDSIPGERPVQGAAPDEASQNYWKKYRYIMAMAIICSLVITTISLMELRLSSKDGAQEIPLPTIKQSTTSTRMTTMTTTVSATSLCSTGAKWKDAGVTVAGFTNGTASTSLGGLNDPNSLFVDAEGNMLIADTGGIRISYWPRNASEGRVVYGRNESGWAPNQLHVSGCFAVEGEWIYVLDSANQRVQSFRYTNETELLNPTTVFDLSMLVTARSFPVLITNIDYDGLRNLLYLIDFLNNRLIIVNRTENDTEIVFDTELFVMSGSVQISPMTILIDEKSDVFYVSDATQHTVFKFKYGNWAGEIIAGSMIATSITNQLFLPMGLAIDMSSYLYIADTGFQRIVQVTNDHGTLRTVAGSGFRGTAPTRLTFPVNVQFDGKHNLYVVDSYNNRIQRFDLLNNGC